MAEEAKIVRLLLEVIKTEFPQFQNDRDSQIAVCVALAAVTGTMGAYILLKEGEPRLNKMLNMVVTRADQMAREGANAVRSRKRIITS